MTLTEAISTLDGKAELTAEDTLALRRILYGQDAQLSQADADAVFRLNADAGSLSAEWSAFFAEVMVDYVVRQQTPPGYVDGAKADWLIASLSRNPSPRPDEIEMLVQVLEQADQTPPELDAFVLATLKSLILWKLEHQNRLVGDDVERLRRVLFAAGGDGNVGVSRGEAEMLFDINDALKGAATVDPAWTDLFARAVANSVLFAPTWAPDAPGEVQREAWLADNRIHPSMVLKALENAGPVVAEGFRELAHLDLDDHDLERAEAADEALEASAEQLTAEEAAWLVERIGRDGRFDANERALVAFIRDNARTIDPSFQDLIARLEPKPPSDRSAAAPNPTPPNTPVFGRRQTAPQST